MRVYAPSNLNYAAAPSAPRRSAGTGFRLAEAEAAQAPASLAAPRAAASIGALIALQGLEDPTERRRRGVKRGKAALDALDEVKIGLLAGTLDLAALARLKTASSAMGEETGDPRLDAILAEVELRAAVELAKLSQRP